MKSEAILRIVIFSIVIVILLAVLAVGLGVGTFVANIDFGGSADYITGEGSVGAADITKLEINWASGNITIQTADTDRITFSEEGYAGEDQTMVYRQSGSRLIIEYCKPSLQIGFVSAPSKDLTITVPTGWECASLDINSAASDAVIEDLVIGEVDLDSASNAFTFTNCQIGTLNVDGASNSIRLTGALEELDCDGMSASITALLNNTPRLMDLDGMSSTLDLTLPADCGFRVTMDGLSNDFSSDFETTSSGGSYLYGDGSCRINVDGLSSSVILRRADDRSRNQ